MNNQHETTFMVYDNLIHTSGTPDVGFLRSFNTYPERANDPGPEDAYEKLFGAGSWENAIKEWRDITVDYIAEKQRPQVSLTCAFRFLLLLCSYISLPGNPYFLSSNNLSGKPLFTR
jgi:hypothetical protein